MRRRRSGRSWITGIIALVIFWLLWQRLHFVVMIQVPWWAALLLGIALLLVIDEIVSRF